MSQGYWFCQYNGKIYYLGAFNTLEEAIKARKEAEVKYLGEIQN